MDPEVVLGLVAAPGAAAGLAGPLVPDLEAALTSRLPGVRWRVAVLVDGLVPPPAPDPELVSAARDRLLASDWDLVVALTDLPLQSERRPVVAHASPVHQVGLVSLPALGPAPHRRVLDLVLRLVETLLGEPSGSSGGRSERLRLRSVELGSDAEGPDAVSLTARVLTGNLRLLAGMVWANRPWRLASRLSRALAAAVAAGVFALVTSDVWRLADRFGPVRLWVVALGSVAAICVTLVVGASLWERPPSRRVRKQVALFNLATLATVLGGVLALYATLFVLAFALSLLLVVPSLLAEQLGHPVGFWDYLQLAWLTSSLATVGGALGAGLESDEAVREAAYSYRPDVPS